MLVRARTMPEIAYVTDVEGRWDKLESFARQNPLVAIDAGGRIDVRGGAVFVFGGDAIDRGPDGRRVVAALLEAKQRRPDRVVLLAGNRDINKMRLVRELAGYPPQRTPEELRSAGRGRLLRWIFEHTMGAREAFEHRRAELERAGLPAGDDDVPASFLADLAPDGPLTRYLAACQLAWKSGSTLFVHGGVTAESLGAVPGIAARVTDLDEWIGLLNAFCARQVAAFQQRVYVAGAPAWAELVDYQAPRPGTRLNQASVVYGRPTDDLGNPRLPERRVIEALARARVTRVVVGHTPSGDCPAVVRDDGFELILADNSYGRIETGSKLLLDEHGGIASGLAVLDGGERVEVRFELDRADPLLGKRDIATGRLVKARLARGDYLLFRGLPGYRVEQLAVPAAAIDAAALEPAAGE